MNSQWSQDTEPNIYALDIFLRKSGYRLSNIEEPSSGLYELIIEPLKPGYLYPDITHMVAEGKFYIDVKKYGELELEDVKGIVKGYENAIAVVTYLESLDLSNLETETKGSEEEE